VIAIRVIFKYDIDTTLLNVGSGQATCARVRSCNATIGGLHGPLPADPKKNVLVVSVRFPGRLRRACAIQPKKLLAVVVGDLLLGLL
jgi:hypothetical protein